MNKLFRFAGVALLTGALVVACDDDEAVVAPVTPVAPPHAYCSGAHLRNRKWHGVRRGFWVVWSGCQPLGRRFAVVDDGKQRWLLVRQRPRWDARRKH